MGKSKHNVAQQHLRNVDVRPDKLKVNIEP